MSILEEILKQIDIPDQPDQSEMLQQRHDPVRRKKTWGPRKTIRARDIEKSIEIVGQPIFTALNWDDLGLGMVRSFGFVPNRPVHLKVNSKKWAITGARTNNTIIPWLITGAGGATFFLQDLLNLVQDWGSIVSTVLVLAPVLLSMLIRIKTIEFFPYELEFFGYDSKTQILIISTLTQPGGLVAMKIDLPTEPNARKIAEDRLVGSLAKMHPAFMRIDGQIKSDYSYWRQRIGWILVGLVLLGLANMYS